MYHKSVGAKLFEERYEKCCSIMNSQVSSSKKSRTREDLYFLYGWFKFMTSSEKIHYYHIYKEAVYKYLLSRANSYSPYSAIIKVFIYLTEEEQQIIKTVEAIIS
jgi:hypothetical protein